MESGLVGRVGSAKEDFGGLASTSMIMVTVRLLRRSAEPTYRVAFPMMTEGRGILSVCSHPHIAKAIEYLLKYLLR